MPPIMGATAFVMASFLNISYVTVSIAAIVPSVLYFFGLFMQIDAMPQEIICKVCPRTSYQN